MKKTIIILCYLLMYSIGNAQSSFLMIKDFDTKEPISVANIVVKSTVSPYRILSQQVCPLTGKFINNYNQKVKLIVEIIGYKTDSFTLNQNEQKTVFLHKLPFDLGEIIVTGTYSRTIKKNAVYDIKSIQGKHLQEKGITNLRGLLNQEVNFSTNNGHANESALTFNGLSGNYVKILIDGVPVEGRLKGSIDLSQINLDNVKKIEILEGPASVEYGTNAIAGAINIITKNNQKKKIVFGLNSYTETVGKYNISANVGVKKNGHFASLNFGRNFFNGYSNMDTSRNKIWKPREQYFVDLNYSKRIKFITFKYGFGYFNELMTSRGAARAPYFISAFDTYNKTKRLNNRFILTGEIQKNHHFNLTLSQSYFNRKRNIYYKDLVSLEQKLSPTPTDQDTTIFENYLGRFVYNNSKKKRKLNFLLGTALKYDMVNSSRISGNKKTIENLSLFGNFKYKPHKNWLIQPAFRMGYNSIFRFPVLPSLNLKYSLKNKFVLRTSFAKGYRSPTIKELFLKFNFNPTINLYGNENLIPENSNHFTLSTSNYFKILKNPTKIKTKVFYNQINQMIELVQFNNTDWKYKNIGNVVIMGAEFKTMYLIKKTNFVFKYQLLGRKNTLKNSFYKDEFHFSNQFLMGSRYWLKKIKTTINLTYKILGKRTGIFENSSKKIVESSLGAYQILDLSAHKKLLKNKLNLTIGAKNLLNTTQIDLKGDMYGLSAQKDATKIDVLWGRTYFISLNYKW